MGLSSTIKCGATEVAQFKLVATTGRKIVYNAGEARGFIGLCE